MNPIYIVIITIVLTVAVCEGIKRLYLYIRRGLRRYFVHHKHFDECWKVTENKILALENRNCTRMTKTELRLADVEKIADNFDRDMDRYHASINKDNSNFTQTYNKKVSGFHKALQSAFKRIYKLELAAPTIDNAFKHFVDDKFEKLEGDYKALSEVVANARNRANKAEERTNSLYDVQLIHAHSISDLEKSTKK